NGPDLVDPNLFNEVFSLPATERYSFIFRGNAMAIDHILTTPRFHSIVTEVAYGRGNADAPFDFIFDDATLLRSSDHDALVVFVDPTMAVIPTLNQWGIMILALGLIIIGFVGLKKRQPIILRNTNG
ncbi:MAG: IPTL-CTERM sorting domain-containing protein, partial [Saprospiraceae bacterium]|nr:IPTL-CTERM sorting domain-containing protein [Saprospiraceae bacterium]